MNNTIKVPLLIICLLGGSFSYTMKRKTREDSSELREYVSKVEGEYFKSQKKLLNAEAALLQATQNVDDARLMMQVMNQGSLNSISLIQNQQIIMLEQQRQIRELERIIQTHRWESSLSIPICLCEILGDPTIHPEAQPSSIDTLP